MNPIARRSSRTARKRSTAEFLLVLAMTIVLLSAALPVKVLAALPYKTGYMNKDEKLIWTQSAYYPVGVLGTNIAMSNPEDMFIAGDDHIYIADTANDRVIHLDAAGEPVQIIDLPESPLSKPQGIFVRDNGDIYVADTGNRRVVRLSGDGKLLREYKRPESKFIPESFKYDPIKVVVDKRGFLYIATLGGYLGLLQMDQEGQFQRFFGANKAAFTFIDSIKQLLYSREMYARELSKLPAAVNNMAIDKDGFIYTVTAGKDVTEQQIKKLNIAGKDMLLSSDEVSGKKAKSYGFASFLDKKQKQINLNDIAVDRAGNMTAIDVTTNFISQYDAMGNLLFFWSGTPDPGMTQLGIVKKPTAIGTNSRQELLVLDSQENAIHVFRLSEFGRMVHEANGLTLEGRYEESEAIWQRVAGLNSNYTPAIMGLAKAAYKKGEFAKAQRLYAEAAYQQGYSEASWQIRLVWFQKHFATMVNIAIASLLVLYAADKVLKRTGLIRRWRRKPGKTPALLRDLSHAIHILKHPIDGFTAIRFESKGGYLSSVLLFIGVYATLCLIRMFTSFSFNKAVVENVNVIQILIQFAVIWTGWVVSNYLISSIYRGEGRFKDMLIGNVYALAPFIVIGLPLTLLSNAMTLGEASIYIFLRDGMYIWVGLLIYWNVQSIHNYSVGETLLNIFLSLFTMLVIGVLVFIVFGLTNELTEFFYSVYQEVSVR